MPASNYVKTNSLSFWLTGATITQPSTLYVALFTGDPGAANLAGNEVSGNNYSRASLTVTTPAISGDYGRCSNSSVVQFPEASGSWGTPTYFGVFDAQASGNMLFYGQLPTTFAVVSGMAPKFNVNDLWISAR